ncbi:Uncharacterised protein [Candidatus Tiddalikarchaeum anstoanum]|nr:Uncharacterised protein [Candidatus Tiddalikarchaeum anstoanum]
MINTSSIILNDNKTLSGVLTNIHYYILEKGGIALENGESRYSGKNWKETYFYKNSSVLISFCVEPLNKSYIKVVSETKELFQEVLRLTPKTLIKRIE